MYANGLGTDGISPLVSALFVQMASLTVSEETIPTIVSQLLFYSFGIEAENLNPYFGKPKMVGSSSDILQIPVTKGDRAFKIGVDMLCRRVMLGKKYPEGMTTLSAIYLEGTLVGYERCLYSVESENNTRKLIETYSYNSLGRSDKRKTTVFDICDWFLIGF